jgi:hypothetical protein
MHDNYAGTPFHGAREYAEIDDRTHHERRRIGGPARKLHAATQQKLRRQLTPVWEGYASPDTTLRAKRGQSAAKCRFSEGNSTVSQPDGRSSGPSRRCPTDTIGDFAPPVRFSKSSSIGPHQKQLPSPHFRCNLSSCKSAASAAHLAVVVCVAHACFLAQGG